MSKTQKKKNKTAQTEEQRINRAAESAAREVEEELEDEGFDEGHLPLSFDRPNDETGEVIVSADVFTEGFKKAQLVGDFPRFEIKKNSQFLAVEGHPCSWEKLQKKYGPGFYQVIAKATTTGRILKSQTLSIGDPNEGREIEEEEDVQESGNSQLAILAMMNQMQERAEARASAKTGSSESALAGVMQAIITAQQSSTQLMMNMMQESNKQMQTMIIALQDKKPSGPDPILALLTAMITKKPDDTGFTVQKVFEMTQAAEKRAEDRAYRTQDLIEKQSDKKAALLIEAESGGKEEGGLSGLMKGFVPILAQMAQNQNAQQPTAEQIAFARLEEQRRMNGMNGTAEGLDFAGDTSTRPAIPAAHPQRQARPVQRRAPSNGTVSTQGGQVVGVDTNKAPLIAKPVAEVQNGAKAPQEVVLDSRQKDMILDMCLPDIGNALLNGVPPGVTADTLLGKLEKEGIPRQTIAKLFTLEEFFAKAKALGVPDEAKPWLKEFHEAIQFAASTESSRTSRNSATTNGAHTNGAVANGAANGARPTVAAVRSVEDVRSTRVQPGASPEGL